MAFAPMHHRALQTLAVRIEGLKQQLERISDEAHEPGMTYAEKSVFETIEDAIGSFTRVIDELAVAQNDLGELLNL